MLIKIYIYQKIDGRFRYSDMGSPDNIFSDLPDDYDFTLTEPPSYQQSYYWYDNNWHSAPKH